MKQKPIVTIEIPEGANPECVSIDSPNLADVIHAAKSRVWVNGQEISHTVFAFCTIDHDGVKRLLLELKDFEIYTADGILGAEELA